MTPPASQLGRYSVHTLSAAFCFAHQQKLIKAERCSRQLKAARPPPFPLLFLFHSGPFSLPEDAWKLLLPRGGTRLQSSTLVNNRSHSFTPAIVFSNFAAGCLTQSYPVICETIRIGIHFAPEEAIRGGSFAQICRELRRWLPFINYGSNLRVWQEGALTSSSLL